MTKNLEQKAMGIASILLSLAIPCISNDITAMLIMLPLGLWLLLSKEQIIC